MMLLCATHPRDFYLCRGNIDSFDFAMLSYVVLLNKYCEHYLTKYWCILQRTIMITFGMMFLYLTDPYDLCICSENLDSFKPCSGFTCGSFKQNKILGKVIKSYATGYSHLPCITIKSRMNLSFSCLRLLTIELSNLAMLSSVIPPDKYLT